MSSFNTKGSSPSVDTTLGVSAKGNVQLKKSSEQILFETLVSFMYGKDTFHESGNAIIARFDTALADVLRRGQFQFVHNLVHFARHEMGMRSMPIYAGVKTTQLCRSLGVKNPLARETVYNSIGRADALTEIYSLALKTFGNKKQVPQAVKKAVADAFEQFDEYQFAKYRSEGKAVWLRDVLRMTHPTPANPDRAALYGRIKTNELKTPETWEVEFSKNGQLPVGKREEEREIWKRLLSRRKLGGLALIRNIRNILQSNPDEELVRLATETLSNPKVVPGNRIFPYQIFQAIKVLDMVGTTVSNKNRFRAALEHALEQSVQNVPDLGDNLWIMIDTSGSMKNPMRPPMTRKGTPVTDFPRVAVVEMAAIFAAIALKQAARYNYNVVVTGFDSTARHLKLNPRDTVLSITEQLVRQATGGSTNIWAALNLKPTLGFEPKTIMLFSDMQMDNPHMGTRYGYLQGGANTLTGFAPEAMKVAFNFSVSETTPASEMEGWMQLAGYSDKVFKFLNMQRPGYANTVVQNLLQGYEVPSRKPEVEEEE